MGKRYFRTVVFAALLLSAVTAFAEPGQSWRGRASTQTSLDYNQADTEAELALGREVAAQLLATFQLTQDQKLQRYVNLVGASLAQNCSRPDLTFHFAVVDSSEINAYSTPGGYVFVTTAALAVMQNEAELAGVLAHEIGHVVERHIVKEINLRGREKSAAASLANLIGGSSEAAAVAFRQSVDLAVNIILRDGYRKQEEIQADSDAVAICALAGYDPKALVSLLERVGQVKGKVGKSYPQYAERIDTIGRVMREEGVDGERLVLHRERFEQNVGKRG